MTTERIDPERPTREALGYRWRVVMTDVRPFADPKGAVAWSEINSKAWRRLDDALEYVVERMVGDRNPSQDQAAERIREEAWEAIENVIVDRVARLLAGEWPVAEESAA